MSTIQLEHRYFVKLPSLHHRFSEYAKILMLQYVYRLRQLKFHFNPSTSETLVIKVLRLRFIQDIELSQMFFIGWIKVDTCLDAYIYKYSNYLNYFFYYIIHLIKQITLVYNYYYFICQIPQLYFSHKVIYSSR